jgi:uncharacterized membrane protein YebE (DUF533 family)
MNKLLRTLFLTVTLAAAGSTFAQSATPLVDQREARQQQRIAQGVASGQLTPRETQRLEAEQARIEQMETRAKADGVVTPAERRQLARKQNRARHHTAKQKHDHQHLH